MPTSNHSTGRVVRFCGALATAMVATALVLAVAPVSVGDQPAPPTSDSSSAGDDESNGDTEPKFVTESLRGKVVFLAAALSDQFGISTVPEAAENNLAVLTGDGQIFPIVENLRGRAFRTDERLRKMEVEILARRYRDQPFIQIVKLFEIDGDQRWEVDYWCDVCAIVMFEKGPCACCQDDNRLRKRPAPRGQ